VTTRVDRHVCRRRRARRGARAGFTLAEIIVAIVILTIGLLAMASTSGAVARQMTGARRQTIAATIAQSRFDSLTSVRCASLAPLSGTSSMVTSGSSTRSGVVESWSVTDGDDVKNITVNITFPGRPTPLVYRSILPCRDSNQ
jgi:prepilin-type N-terminal cleavage/methylation domain-containing protein